MKRTKYHYEVRYEDRLGNAKAHDFFTCNIITAMRRYFARKAVCVVSVRRGPKCD